MRLNKRTRNYLRKKVSGYLSKENKSEELDKYLRLDLGENLLANINPAKILKSLDQDTLKYYTDPSNTTLKEIIAKLYKISVNNISIANSSNELIDVLPKMVMEKGETSIIINPTFFRYEDSVLQVGGKPIYLNLSEEEGYKPNSELINKICQLAIENKAKIIWICNPNNPTGEIYSLSDIEKVVKESKSLVIVDEAFYELYAPKNSQSAIQLIGNYRNLIVLRTLSKGYGLAGLRMGYAIANSTTISVIEQYRDTLLMTSGVVVKLAKQILSNQKYIEKIEQTAHQTRIIKRRLYSQISKLSNLQIGSDTKTNVYLLRHKTKNLYEELLQRGIKTADFRQSAGLENLGYIRVTIGNEAQNKKLLAVLKEVN